MKLKNHGNLVLAGLMLTVPLSGCQHQLQIKNLNTYYNTSVESLKTPLCVGLRSMCTGADEQKLAHGISSSLPKYNMGATRVIRTENSNLDVLATVSILSDYKGSGWNFLINWPGFLVWAPAWHGYNYQVTHNVTVHLSDAKTGESIDTINVPVILNVRHADIDRTWTELSWLEWSVIAFVGGIVFINYDEDVTPLVAEKASPVVADYIAQEMARSLATHYKQTMAVTPAATDISVEAKLKKLNALKAEGALTTEQYQEQLSSLMNTGAGEKRLSISE